MRAPLSTVHAALKSTHEWRGIVRAGARRRAPPRTAVHSASEAPGEIKVLAMSCPAAAGKGQSKLRWRSSRRASQPGTSVRDAWARRSASRRDGAWTRSRRTASGVSSRTHAHREASALCSWSHPRIGQEIRRTVGDRSSLLSVPEVDQVRDPAGWALAEGTARCKTHVGIAGRPAETGNMEEYTPEPFAHPRRPARPRC